MRDHVMKQMDTDGDHRISRAEFLAVYLTVFHVYCRKANNITSSALYLFHYLRFEYSFRIGKRKRKNRIRVGKILATKISTPRKN